MIESLVPWTIGALLGTLLGRVRRQPRRRAAARARQRHSARVMLDELSAFATGLDLAIAHRSTAPIADPTAIEAAWRQHQDALRDLPASDLKGIERAVRYAVNVDAARGPETLGDARTEILAGVEILRAHLE
jgi:hypothetical protein